MHLNAQAEEANCLLQIKKIAEIALQEKYPMIIAGDFNAEPESEVINILDTFPHRNCCEDYAPTIPLIDPERAIDFVTFRPGLTFELISREVIQEIYASDHLPVLSELSLGD